MSELRWNPISKEWVVTATHRQDRTFFPPPGFCPLCPTQPGGFPTEIPLEAYDIVVFENKFPSFRLPPPEPAVTDGDLFHVMPAEGVCEVVCYTSDHNATLAQCSVDQITKLVGVWRERYLDLGARPEVDYVFIFENKGEAIGVTLPHPHGQIYAFSYLPPKIERELSSANDHHRKTGRCLHCDVIAEERVDGRRIVAESEHFIAFVPFYARYPYELHVYAKGHLPSMAEFTPAQERDLARMLKALLQKFDNLWQMSFPYMMVMHQNPTDGQEHPGAHFHIEFYPPHRTKEKLKFLAGCESGAGTFINDTLPEDKAQELRALAPQLEEIAP
jgi:UDPglucose--hexose-1-phosphate uridylyltransferase